MKSNKVRMEISRRFHEAFKLIDGNTNDERMEKLLRESSSSDFLPSDAELELIRVKSSEVWYKRALQIQKDNCKFLAGALAVSIMANFGMLVYIALTNGWLV